MKKRKRAALPILNRFDYTSDISVAPSVGKTMTPTKTGAIERKSVKPEKGIP